MGKYKHTVTEEEYGMSINEILRSNFNFSARFKTKIKFQNLLDLNGVQAKGFMKPEVGDLISIRLPKETSDFPAEDIPIDVLYEDDDLLIINKQPGIIVHPTKGHPFHTIANGLMKYMQDTSQEFKVRFANRIDMDTSGIVICAKNANCQDSISNQMKGQDVVKKYVAIVHGRVEDDCVINLPVGRPDEVSIRRCVMEEGKDATTIVKVLEAFDDYSLLELTIMTGRTHQIRVHLSHIGHPIIGDALYEGEAPGLIERQALHAYHIEFIHPMTEERLTIEAPYPDDMLRALELIRCDSHR
ncbi:MAG: RluA family pseudouridine synthase [Anaerovoracaceae bacterium]